jgi:hypothetical protein
MGSQERCSGGNERDPEQDQQVEPGGPVIPHGNMAKEDSMGIPEPSNDEEAEEIGHELGRSRQQRTDELRTFHGVGNARHDIEYQQGDGNGEDSINQGDDPLPRIGRCWRQRRRRRTLSHVPASSLSR